MKIEDRICGSCGHIDSKHLGEARMCPMTSFDGQARCWASNFRTWSIDFRVGPLWTLALELARFAEEPDSIGIKGICQCDMRDLLSGAGHLTACPEKKIRRSTS